MRRLIRNRKAYPRRIERWRVRRRPDHAIALRRGRRNGHAGRVRYPNFSATLPLIRRVWLDFSAMCVMSTHETKLRIFPTRA